MSIRNNLGKKGRRRHWNRLLKNPYCVYCKKRVKKPHYDIRKLEHDTATKEHLIPLNAGGSNRVENIVLACNECNNLLARYGL